MQDNGYRLTIYVNFMVKCVCYMGYGSNGCFMDDITLMSSHYKTNIISDVGHSRLDSIVPLVLCTVVYNIRHIGVVLQVPRDSTNPTGKG
jgi:hypothetical protein